MTITLDLEPEMEARLRDKAERQGQDAGAVVKALIAEALECEAQERAETVAGIERGLQDFAQGRSRSHEELFNDKRVRFNLPNI